MTDPSAILIYGAVFFAGAGLSWAVLRSEDRRRRRDEALQASSVIDKARAEADAILREAKLEANEQALKRIEETEQSFAARRIERAELERRLSEREALLNSQLQRIIETERSLEEQQKTIDARCEELHKTEARLATEAARVHENLEKHAGLTSAQAREIILKHSEHEASLEAQTLTRTILEEAKASADQKARHILSTAIQRYAGEHTFQTTTTTITINGEDIKGRIIGREGRNIRAFEAATGVTVLIDETPGAVLLSGFDPVRREIAREAMSRLLVDGRIHPTRIEEIVGQVTQEVNALIQKLGEEAVVKCGLTPLAPELVAALGRLHFRHSYSQNILDHSIEVAHLMGLMAAELGIDITTAKRTGLLHDIGKAVSHEMEGPHAIVGAELLRKYGETKEVINGVASHHSDVPPEGPLGILVSAADAISASRPGARSESMTTYLKRVEDLEKIAASFPGVEKTFAVHAGRELRVFVQPETLDDQAAFALARSITSRIEEQLQYPGQIKVVVIRETRCVEVAK